MNLARSVFIRPTLAGAAAVGAETITVAAAPYRRGRVLPAVRSRPIQASLFCPCGRASPTIAGLCLTCYWRERNWIRRFAGLREEVLNRDGRGCRACGTKRNLIVHHRMPGVNDVALLITLCRKCHVRVHQLSAVRSYVSPMLRLLWAEQHPESALQLQFLFDGA